jgi:hypothetical protein
VLAGASLTDDYRNASFTYPDGTTRYTQNASQRFMIGPTLGVELTDNVSVEVNAMRRRIITVPTTNPSDNGRPMIVGRRDSEFS